MSKMLVLFFQGSTFVVAFSVSIFAMHNPHGYLYCATSWQEIGIAKSLKGFNLNNPR
jgi:hypothetical protein